MFFHNERIHDFHVLYFFYLYELYATESRFFLSTVLKLHLIIQKDKTARAHRGASIPWNGNPKVFLVLIALVE